MKPFLLGFRNNNMINNKNVKDDGSGMISITYVIEGVKHKMVYSKESYVQYLEFCKAMSHEADKYFYGTKKDTDKRK